MKNTTRYLVVGSLGVLMTRQNISPLAVKGLKCLTCMHAKSCIYKLTTGTEKHHTKYLIFLIFSNKNIIEDAVFLSCYFIFTGIDNKLKLGCSNILEAHAVLEQLYSNSNCRGPN